MSDQQTDRLEEIRDRGRSFGGGPERSEWEWLLRVVEAADELIGVGQEADGELSAIGYRNEFDKDDVLDLSARLRRALRKYQEVRRG